MTHLIVVEKAAHVSAAIELARARRDSLLLGVSPQAAYALERAGVPFQIPEDFHTEEEINQVGIADWALLARLEAELDPILLSLVPELRPLEAGPVALSWYEWRNLLNSHTITAFLVDRILSVTRPATVSYFRNGTATLRWDAGFLNGSPWPRAVPEVCRARSVPYRELVLPPVPAPHPVPRARAVWRERAGRVLGTVRRNVHEWLTRDPVPGAPTLIALRLGYAIPDLLREIRARRCFRVWHWDLEGDSGPTPVFPASPPALRLSSIQMARRPVWSHIRSDAVIRNLFNRDGIDLLGMIAPQVEIFCDQTLFSIVLLAANARCVLSELKPALFLSTNNHWRERVLTRVARSHGIPFVVFHHGASGAAVLMETHGYMGHYQIEWRWSSHILVWGDGDKGYIQRWHPDGGEAIPVGSPELDELKRQQGQRAREAACLRMGLDPRRPVVVYVLGVLAGIDRVAPYRNRSPGRAFEIHRRLGEVFADFPDIQVVFKVHLTEHPDDSTPLAELFADRGWSNCRVERRPFKEILAGADLFVTDMPVTNFLEMLTTDRPILVCGHEMPWKFKVGVWDPHVIPMWRERVQYADTLEEFVVLLRRVLRQRQFQPVRDRWLLRQFGSHLDDGQSARRACEALVSIAEKPQPWA